MVNETQITRTCLSCGLEKPISAFLQLTGAKGTTYGNICSSCRTANAAGQKHFATEEPEEETSTGSGLKIDAKAKVHYEQEKKKHIKEINELSIEEKNLEQELKNADLDAKKAQEFDKNQRDKQAAEKKKSNLFTKKSTTDMAKFNHTNFVTNTAIQVDNKIQQDKFDEKSIVDKAQDNTATWSTNTDTQQKKTATSIFNTFTKRQRDTINTKLLNRKFHERNANAAKSKFITEKKNAATKETKDPLATQADKNWGPNSTRRR